MTSDRRLGQLGSSGSHTAPDISTYLEVGRDSAQRRPAQVPNCPASGGQLGAFVRHRPGAGRVAAHPSARIAGFVPSVCPWTASIAKSSRVCRGELDLDPVTNDQPVSRFSRISTPSPSPDTPGYEPECPRIGFDGPSILKRAAIRARQARRGPGSGPRVPVRKGQSAQNAWSVK